MAGSAWLAPQDVADIDYLGWTSVSVGSDGIARLARTVYRLPAP